MIRLHKPLRMALLDDHQIVIDGMKLLLKDEKDFKVVMDATQVDVFFAQLKTTEVDIVISDIILPNQLHGLEVARRIKARFPHIRILVLSMNEEPKTIHDLIHGVGVEGFISKAAGRDDLFTALNVIGDGGSFYSKETHLVLDRYAHRLNDQEYWNLSARELDVARCIDQRMPNKKMAEHLFISERTVETHRKNIYRKTGTKGEAELILFLKERGLLD